MIKSPRIILLTAGAVAAVVLLLFLASGFFTTSSERVLSGVKAGGIDLQGCNKEEGLQKLAGLEKDLKSRRIVMRYKDNSWPLLLSEAGLNLNKEKVMESALSIGRRGSILLRWEERSNLKTGGLNVALDIGFEQERLTQRVKEMTAKVTREPQDAVFKINSDDSVTVMPAEDGTSVDIEKLTADITDIISSGKDGEVLLSLIKVEPTRSTASMQAMGVNGFLGGFTTWFDSSKAGRSYNVSVAARALDELLVPPGQEVSFNEVVGPRSTEAGYKTAPEIVNNELVDGIGGGVCQVSTTLYNSVLMADLDVVERVNHSLPVSYIPIGRDATVVDNAIDFIFRNNTDSYLYFKSIIGNGSLTINIYGNSQFKKDVVINSWVTQVIEPNVVYETDPNLPKGEEIVKREGAKGFKAAAVRVIMKDGVVLKRETLPSSDYSPVNKVVAVGEMEAGPQLAPSIPPSSKPSGTVVTPGKPDSPAPPAVGNSINPAIPGVRAGS